MRETPVQVAYPSVDNPHLRLAIGACRFTARPGEGDAWVAGTYHDPTDRRPTRIVEDRPEERRGQAIGRDHRPVRAARGAQQGACPEPAAYLVDQCRPGPARIGHQ